MVVEEEGVVERDVKEQAVVTQSGGGESGIAVCGGADNDRVECVGIARHFPHYITLYIRLINLEGPDTEPDVEAYFYIVCVWGGG